MDMLSNSKNSWLELEKYKTVKRWITRVQSTGTGSEKTRISYLRCLGNYCKFTKNNPDELITKRHKNLESKDEVVKRKHEEMAMAFFNDLSSKRARKTAGLALTAVRSFYKANYTPLQIQHPKIWVTNVDKVPTLEEIKRMVDVSDNALQRALILFSAQSGQREGIIAALRYGMIRKELESGKSPICIQVYAELKNRRGEKVNKERQTYFFFIGKDGIEALNNYLQVRKSLQGDIEDTDFLFVTEKPRSGIYFGLNESAINIYVKRAAIKAGLLKKLWTGDGSRSEIHHHSLRKFWQTAMEQAGVAKTWYEFMMGHSLGQIDRAYSRPSIEQVRGAYKRGESYLSVSKTSKDMDTMKKNIMVEMLQNQASMMGINIIDIKIEKQKELGRELTLDDELEAYHQAFKRFTFGSINTIKNMNSNNNNNYESKIVSEEELVKMVEDGWELLKDLNGNKFLMRRLREH